ncbi:MAG: hypothetical protein E7255_06365 [Lachnospiraceae bacterium]|jgi:uncharacterized BrkB/YihY/UPF0761 family membrane protein|nr:hypothetical protein [Lachnospiraceae bacterium]
MKEQMKKYFKKFCNIQLDGVGVVEIILILVILIGLVLIFKDQITAIVEKAFKVITKDTNSIIG